MCPRGTRLVASDGRGAGRQCFNIAFKWLECARALSSAAEGEIAEADLTDMREAFDYFDKDGTGFITKCELGAMMRMLGMNMSKTELQVTGLGDGERECGFYEANDTHRKRYRPMVLPHTKLGARLGSRNKSSVPPRSPVTHLAHGCRGSWTTSTRTATGSWTSQSSCSSPPGPN